MNWWYVLISARHQLLQRLTPIRPVVVPAGKVERSNRVVRGPNREEAHRSAAGPAFAFNGAGRLAHRVADRGGFSRFEVLAQPAAAVQAGRRQRMRPAGIGSGGHEQDLLGAQLDQLFEQPREDPRSIAQPVNLAPPVGIRRKTQRARLAGNRHGERSGQDPGR